MKELSLINCRLDKRYEIREQLGRGSYAEIYLARDLFASPQSPHNTVVLKALNVFLQNDLDEHLERTLVENFQNEAVALDRVRHPNIISRLGHGTARDLAGTVFHYLVLEYLAGGDMQELLRNRKLSLSEALKLIEQVCAGLGHAHECGIIHRDIKPQNLLLTPDHVTVKIADFGVARDSIADSPITRVGTNAYAPPEHSPLTTSDGANAENKLTPAADVYSLGKTIYAMVAGESPRRFANAQITDLPESIASEVWAADLLQVLKCATEPDPSARYQTVAELWSDLAAVAGASEGGEPETVLRTAETPQARVARGYTPIAPAEPKFESRPEILISHTMPFQVLPTGPLSDSRFPSSDLGTAAERASAEPVENKQKKPVVIRSGRRPMLRRVVTFAVAIGMFAGLLYGTASYMRGRGFFPEVGSVFKPKPIAVANTDIYLRPGPNADGDPIGLVTKNSKVRIVNSQNNWYQVDVVEQGRARPQTANATRGWLNGKYLDINEN